MIKDEDLIIQESILPSEWLYDGDDLYCVED